jgi:hypothetical protein
MKSVDMFVGTTPLTAIAAQDAPADSAVIVWNAATELRGVALYRVREAQKKASSGDRVTGFAFIPLQCAQYWPVE